MLLQKSFKQRWNNRVLDKALQFIVDIVWHGCRRIAEMADVVIFYEWMYRVADNRLRKAVQQRIAALQEARAMYLEALEHRRELANEFGGDNEEVAALRLLLCEAARSLELAVDSMSQQAERLEKEGEGEYAAMLQECATKTLMILHTA